VGEGGGVVVGGGDGGAESHFVPPVGHREVQPPPPPPPPSGLARSPSATRAPVKPSTGVVWQLITPRWCLPSCS